MNTRKCNGGSTKNARTFIIPTFYSIRVCKQDLTNAPFFLLGFPNGLSIDYEMQRLYWVDAKLDKIETSDFNGDNRAVLIRDIIHPFGLAVVSFS